jgi:hypothetical protein
MADKGRTQKLTVTILLVTPRLKTPLGRIIDIRMKGHKGKSRYQFMSLLHELLLFFINSFFLFPSHIKRIILCFVYSDDHHPSFIYPSLEEEDLHTACIVDIDSYLYLSQFIKMIIVFKSLLN